jgi:hypothetical protein
VRSNKRAWRHYCFSEQVNLGAWIVLILLEGMIAGATLFASDLSFTTAMWFPIPFLLPLILYREGASVDEETGQTVLRKGFWPLAGRYRFKKGELRRVFVSGANLGITTSISLWIEDRSGTQVRICSEGPEVVDGAVDEGLELAQILGVPFDYSWSYNDARRRILSSRRPLWFAGWELLGAGGAVMLFVLYVSASMHGSNLPFSESLRSWEQLPLGDSTWANVVLWIGSFLALALAIVGVPLLWENREHWARTNKS